MHTPWLKLSALVTALAVGSISLMASAGIGRSVFSRVKSVPGGDTTLHFILIGGMAFVATLAFVTTNRRRQFRQLCRVVLVVGILVSIDEFLQLWLPLRTFSFTDLLANYAGILVFSLAAFALRRAATSGLASAVAIQFDETSSSNAAQ